MPVKFGQCPPETIVRWLRLFSSANSGRIDYLGFLHGLIKRGDNLADREKNDLIKWLVANRYTTKRIGDLFTVQYTHSECAAALGCSELQAKRYRSWAVENDVLITVHPGKKGYPGFYIVAPVLVSKSADIDTGKRVSIETGKGINLGEIGYQPKSPELGKQFHIHNYPELSRKDNEKWKCSICGSHDFEIQGNLIICKKCITAHQIPP